ncbi:Protein get-1 [Paramyrothecium foliicola]|nr:Protein get-1 [Paramyrothecium foliicola]
MPSILVTVFLFEAAARLINAIGATTLNNLIWTAINYLPVATANAAAEQRKIQADYLKVRRELNATSSQDQFAKWAKLRRQHDKLLEQLETAKKGLDGSRSKFDSYLTAVRLILTRGPQLILPFWYGKAPVFWLPNGWFPYWAEWFFSLPRAPLGSVSVASWQVACVGLLTMITDLVLGIVGLLASTKQKEAPFKGQEKKKTTQEKPSAQAVREEKELVRSLVIFFGPIVLPKAISYYRSLRSAPRQHGVAVQPVPPRVRLALALLLALVVAYLAKTLPVLSPENLFKRTGSPLSMPTEGLFQRLAGLRPDNTLTPRDETLRSKFVSKESRLLYLQYGPEVLADCPFCNVDDPRTYLYYAFPTLAQPHLINLFAIAIATSPSLTGKYGAQWRVPATIAAILVAVAEIYLVSSFNHMNNARAKKRDDVEYFFWTTRIYRLVALAALDAVLGWVLYLSSTNRAFVQLPSPAERVESVNRALINVKSKVNALGIVKNTALRDEGLRTRSQTYWAHEVRLMGEVMEERDVVEGVKDALSNRINIQAITRDAESYAESVIEPLRVPPPGSDGS